MEANYGVALILFAIYNIVHTFWFERHFSSLRRSGVSLSDLRPAYWFLFNRLFLKGAVWLTCFYYFGLEAALLFVLVAGPAASIIKICFDERSRLGQVIQSVYAYAMIFLAYWHVNPAYLRLIIVLSAIWVVASTFFPNRLGVKSPLAHIDSDKLPNAKLTFLLVATIMLVVSETVWHFLGLGTWVWVYAFQEMLFSIYFLTALGVMRFFGRSWLPGSP